MEPRIQYAKTSDGVNIAFAEFGTDRPLLIMPSPGYSHAELNSKVWLGITSRASTSHTVSFDARGTGLSDRDALDYSIEALIRDLEAVVARINFDSFVLAAWSHSVPVAVTYTVANPGRVSRLILIDGYGSFRDFIQVPAWKASASLLEMDWQLYTETLGQVMWAHSNPQFGRLLGEFMRACSEPEAARAMYRAWEARDVSMLLPQIAVPTLVIHNKNNRLVPMTAGQRIAAAIPGARFATIDDPTYAAVSDIAEAFMAETEAAPEPASAVPSGTAVILFADMTGRCSPRRGFSGEIIPEFS